MHDRLSLCNPIPKLVTEEPSSSGRSVAGGNARSTTTTKKKQRASSRPRHERNPRSSTASPPPEGEGASSSIVGGVTRHHLPHIIIIISGQMPVRGGRRPRSNGWWFRGGKGARSRETGTRGIARAEKHGRPRVVPVLIKLSLVGGVIEHQFWVEFVFFSCCCCFSTKEVLLCWIQKMSG